MRWLSVAGGKNELDEWVRSERAKVVRLDTPLAGKVAALISHGNALRGAELAAILQIDHLNHKRFDECSSGEQQLVRLAHALAESASAFVLVEPFRYLDRFRSEHLIMLLHRLESLGVRLAYTDRSLEDGVARLFHVTSTRTSPELIVNDVSYRHPLQADYAVEHVSLTIDTPGLTVCTGTNGSGKSTLLELMAKSLRPLYGKVKWSERPIYLPPEQEFGPFPDSSSRRFDQLQAVLASDVSLILLDEPTIGLTKGERIDFERALLKKAETAHVVCASHDVQLIATANRILCLSSGTVVFDGTRDDYSKRSMLWSPISSSS